jgi:hypothetical protein
LHEDVMHSQRDHVCSRPGRVWFRRMGNQLSVDGARQNLAENRIWTGAGSVRITPWLNSLAGFPAAHAVTLMLDEAARRTMVLVEGD